MTIDRQTMEVDIACVGFGPATAGFMHTLSQAMTAEDGSVLLESKVMPGMPLQVVCYERADDIGFGVSGGSAGNFGLTGVGIYNSIDNHTTSSVGGF